MNGWMASPDSVSMFLQALEMVMSRKLVCCSPMVPKEATGSTGVYGGGSTALMEGIRSNFTYPLAQKDPYGKRSSVQNASCA